MYSIWRDVPEHKSTTHAPPKADPTAAARSSIRRRLSVHGHGRRPLRGRLSRDPSALPPRFERSPPPSVGFNGGLRRNASTSVPPISALLEHVPAPPPPPVPETRNYFDDASIAEQERSLRSSISDLQARAARLERNTAALRDGSLGHGDEEVQLARQNLAARLQEASGHRRPDRNVLQPSEDLPTDRSHHRIASPTLPLETLMSIPRLNRGHHPLRHSWRPTSPLVVDGLGDRTRSPTPAADSWEIMRSTITPDATLPSAESSFTSAVASRSFTSHAAEGGETAASSNTTISSGYDSSSYNNSNSDSADDSASSLDDNEEDEDEDDLVCLDEHPSLSVLDSNTYTYNPPSNSNAPIEAVAEELYFYEMRTPAGRARLAVQQQLRLQEGNRFGHAREPTRVEIGFRLLESALESAEGRERVERVQEEMAVMGTRGSGRRRGEWEGEGEGEGLYADTPPTPRAGAEGSEAAREASEQVHDYFQQFTRDALAVSSSVQQQHPPRTTTSPPPSYEPPTSQQENALSTNEPPHPWPVGAPRSSRPASRAYIDFVPVATASAEVRERIARRVASSLGMSAHAAPATQTAAHTDAEMHDEEAGEAGESEPFPHAAATRSFVERLVRRDDVPEAWWRSFGVDVSGARTTEREVSRAGVERRVERQTARRGGGQAGRSERVEGRERGLEGSPPRAAGRRVRRGRVERVAGGMRARVAGDGSRL